MALLAHDEADLAITYLAGALSRHPSDLQIVLLSAEGNELRKPPFRTSVKKFLIAALALRPDSTEIRHVLAKVRLIAHSPKRAIALWEDILQKRPDWQSALLHLSRAHLSVDDAEAALRTAGRAVELDSGSATAQMALACAEILSGAGKDAIDRLRGLEREEGLVRSRAQSLLGRTLLQDGRLGEAREALAGDLRRRGRAEGGRRGRGVRSSLSRGTAWRHRGHVLP